MRYTTLIFLKNLSSVKEARERIIAPPLVADAFSVLGGIFFSVIVYNKSSIPFHVFNVKL